MKSRSYSQQNTIEIRHPRITKITCKSMKKTKELIYVPQSVCHSVQWDSLYSDWGWMPASIDPFLVLGTSLLPGLSFLLRLRRWLSLGRTRLLQLESLPVDMIFSHWVRYFNIMITIYQMNAFLPWNGAQRNKDLLWLTSADTFNRYGSFGSATLFLHLWCGKLFLMLVEISFLWFVSTNEFYAFVFLYYIRYFQ